MILCLNLVMSSFCCTNSTGPHRGALFFPSFSKKQEKKSGLTASLDFFYYYYYYYCGCFCYDKQEKEAGGGGFGRKKSKNFYENISASCVPYLTNVKKSLAKFSTGFFTATLKLNTRNPPILGGKGFTQSIVM